jgi:hypothetical protein
VLTGMTGLVLVFIMSIEYRGIVFHCVPFKFSGQIYIILITKGRIPSQASFLIMKKSLVKAWSSYIGFHAMSNTWLVYGSYFSDNNNEKIEMVG